MRVASYRDLVHIQVLGCLLLGLDLVRVGSLHRRHEICKVDLLSLNSFHPHHLSRHDLVTVLAKYLIVVLHLLLL